MNSRFHFIALIFFFCTTPDLAGKGKGKDILKKVFRGSAACTVQPSQIRIRLSEPASHTQRIPLCTPTNHNNPQFPRNIDQYKSRRAGRAFVRFEAEITNKIVFHFLDEQGIAAAMEQAKTQSAHQIDWYMVEEVHEDMQESTECDKCLDSID
ncbi:MAG TPA: hypothetical protein VI521_03175 [Candidatus Babeliales bacterium]|nr:hypothetical protein [Candidatus Babeliales bacterium]